MKITRERKIYGAILAVGLAVLGADQMLGAGTSAPHSAEASTAMPTVMTLPTTSDAAPEAQAKPGVNHWLAQRLTGSDAAAADAFKVPAAWTQASAATQAHSRTGAAPTYRLRAVMMSDTGGLALINDRYVKLGQPIDGLTLVEVRPGAAVLANEHQRVELKLEHTGLTDADR